MLHTNDPYGAESDKIIQIHQNLTVHEAFLTQIGAWSFLLTALVKQLKGIELYAKQYYISAASGAAQTTPNAYAGTTTDGTDGEGGSGLPDDLGNC